MLANFVGRTIKAKFGLSQSIRALQFFAVSYASNFISSKYLQNSVRSLRPAHSACARNNSGPVVSWSSDSFFPSGDVPGACTAVDCFPISICLSTQ